MVPRHDINGASSAHTKKGRTCRRMTPAWKTSVRRKTAHRPQNNPWPFGAPEDASSCCTTRQPAVHNTAREKASRTGYAARTRLALWSASASGGRSAAPSTGCPDARAISGETNENVRRENSEAVFGTRVSASAREARMRAVCTDLLGVDLRLRVLRFCTQQSHEERRTRRTAESAGTYSNGCSSGTPMPATTQSTSFAQSTPPSRASSGCSVSVRRGQTSRIRYGARTARRIAVARVWRCRSVEGGESAERVDSAAAYA
jgi:hypothetical protein